MSVVIPLTRIATRAIRPRLFSGSQEGTLGGPDLQIPRPGDRFAVDIETTQLRQDADARLLIAALTEATTADARIDLPQYDLAAASTTGTGVVADGAGQTGSTVNLRGAQVGSTVLRGQYLTIAHSGLGYVYMATAQRTAGSDGKIALPIWPMLRVQTTDADAVAIDSPYLEGHLIGFDKGASFVRAKVQPLSFSIEERA